MSKTKETNFTKKDISKKIDSTIGLPFSYANELSEDIIKILKFLIKEKEINIKNFGTFKIINKKLRQGRNPKTQKIYKISARKTLSFRVSKKLNEKINF